MRLPTHFHSLSKLTKIHDHMFPVLVALAIISPSAHGEGCNWKESNAAAIAAMRAEKFEEAEKLFQQALQECKTPEDKATVKTNLSVLLQKLGRQFEEIELQGEVSANSNDARFTKSAQQRLEPSPPTKVSSTKDIHKYISELDEAIKKADAAGELEALQALFQKKAAAVKLRDRSESLEYAYVLHFRAQVLQHLHRNAEASSLEQYAARVRDANRRLQQQQSEQASNFFSTPAAAPSIQRSTLVPFGLNFDPGTPVHLPNLDQQYTDPNKVTTTPDSMKSTIDRNTTNIQKTPSASSVMNSHRNFGK